MRVLVVEDDEVLAQQLASSLQIAGYTVDISHDGAQAQYQGEVESYDAIVLDLGLPKVDGLTVLRYWRAAKILVPVIILTARDSWHEKVSGIDAGADDYLAKPFHMEELLARIRALIRRNSNQGSAIWSYGDISLDTAAAKVAVNGQYLNLTSHEYKVLAILMQRIGQVVSRTELTEHIYAQDFDRDSNTIDVFIGRLRKKLPPNIIETVRGLGYRIGT